MFRRDAKGRYVLEYSFFSSSYYFHSGNSKTSRGVDKEKYKNIMESQQEIPVVVMTSEREGRSWWMFQGKFFVEDEKLTETEVKALALETISKGKRKIQRVVSLIGREEDAPTKKREMIPEDVKIYVWRRDNGKCVTCGSKKNLEYDHIIPVSRGGSSTKRNVQILCERCNREKRDNIS